MGYVTQKEEGLNLYDVGVKKALLSLCGAIDVDRVVVEA
jgi:hypothetical protein